MNWKEVIIAAVTDGATTLIFCGSPFAEYYRRSNEVPKLPGRCRWRFWTAHRRAGNTGISARATSTPPEWGAMLLGDALELIYVAPWTVMLPGGDNISVLLVNLLGNGIRRAIVRGWKKIMPLLDIRDLTIELKPAKVG